MACDIRKTHGGEHDPKCRVALARAMMATFFENGPIA
jgi:hypothetical protein